MPQRRRPRAGLVGLVLAVGLPLVASGCSLTDVLVVVAGRDANGTLVVGATDCSTGGGPADEIRLVDLTEGLGRRVLWSVADGSSARTRAGRTPVQPPPPPPVPSRIDRVSLLAVGDPDPPGWQLVTELVEPLPEGGRLIVEVDQGTIETVITTRLDLPSERTPDRFVAEIDGVEHEGISGADLADAIDQRCDEVGAFDGGRFFAILGISAAVLAALGVAVALLTVRQYRRAGRAVADRRAAHGLPGLR